MTNEEIDATLFSPVRVTRLAQPPGDGIESGDVFRRVLTDVETNKRRAERVDATQHVGQASIGNELLSRRDQRVVAELQWLQQIFRLKAEATRIFVARIFVARGFRL